MADATAQADGGGEAMKIVVNAGYYLVASSEEILAAALPDVESAFPSVDCYVSPLMPPNPTSSPLSRRSTATSRHLCRPTGS
jgi:hypothetical protein